MSQYDCTRGSLVFQVLLPNLTPTVLELTGMRSAVSLQTTLENAACWLAPQNRQQKTTTASIAGMACHRHRSAVYGLLSVCLAHYAKISDLYHGVMAH